MWTRFYDMHSGGRRKTPYEIIYIEGTEEEARRVFSNKFDLDPDNVTCDCCGDDYSIASHESLNQLTAYDRHCDYDKQANRYVERDGKRGEYITLDDYKHMRHVCFIPAQRTVLTDCQHTAR